MNFIQSLVHSHKWMSLTIRDDCYTFVNRMWTFAAEELNAAYQEIKDVVTVGRGLGIWGDMVVTLKNNNKIELRSLPQ